MIMIPHDSKSFRERFRPIGRVFLALTTAAVLLLLARPMLVSSQGGSEPIVRCAPLEASEWAGTSITIDMYIENVVDLYAADERLAFDATGLQVEDANNYPDDGVQIEPLDDLMKPDYVIKKDADNSEGTIWYAATQVSPTMQVTGSGSIARITFDAIRAGTYTLPVTYAKLSDRHGVEITSTTQDCRIIFWGPIDLTISRPADDNDLSWSYLGSDIDHFEVWRSNVQPYLTPEGPDAVQLQPDPAPGATTYTDADAPTSENQYYVVRAVKADAITKSAPSNRVGAFHFALVPGSG